MDELKKTYPEPELETVPSPEVLGSVLKRNARLQVEQGSSADERTDPQGTTPKLSTLSTPPSLTSSPFNLQSSLFNTLVTLILLLSYHLLFNQTSTPVSPQPTTPGVVQGVSTATDPRLDDLITKFQDHLSAELLKDAAPTPVTTINLDNTSVTAGRQTLTKGSSQVTTTNSSLTPTTVVTATFTSDFSPAKKYWITPTQGSFTLSTDFPVGQDSSFNYSFLAPTSTSSAIIKP